MKSQGEIQRILDKLDTQSTKYQAMTYEMGIEEALLWVMDEIPDEEFSPTQEQ